MRLRLGFQPSITTLFVTAVLFVGLTLVYLSFDRATSITRSAASTFVDRVAQHTTDRVETEFKMVIDLVTILGQLPTVEFGDDLRQSAALRDPCRHAAQHAAALQPLCRL